jgi:hypothetical protein
MKDYRKELLLLKASAESSDIVIDKFSQMIADLIKENAALKGENKGLIKQLEKFNKRIDELEEQIGDKNEKS